jgi:hypothetical protein
MRNVNDVAIRSNIWLPNVRYIIVKFVIFMLTEACKGNLILFHTYAKPMHS